MRNKRKRLRDAVKQRAERTGVEHLNAESRALLGGEEKPRSMRPEPRDDASVEDPLLDWPEE